MTPGVAGQAAKFAVVGALNTLVGLSVILGGMAFFGMNDFAANALGYAVGMVVSFVGNRSWTFDHRGPWAPTLGRFLLMFAAAYAVNLLTLLLVRDGLRQNSYFAQIAGVMAYTVTFFVGCRVFAFRSSVSPPP
jgi:putative flippase GtrA